MGEKLIDTIGAQFSVHINLDTTVPWDEKLYKKARGGGCYKRILNITLDNGAPIQYTYYPYANKGLPLLNVEFSLPHMVLGNNVDMVFNLPQAITEANELLPDIPGVPTLNLWKGVIYRLDPCYNFQVGNLVPHYIRAIQFLDYPRREISPYRTGFMFKTNQEAVKIYDKEKERLKEKDAVGAEAARAILRLEVTLRKQAVRKLAGKKKPTIRDISIDLLFDKLEKELDKLGLLNRSIANRKTALEQLCAKYGPRAGVYYFGLLVSKVEQPSKAVIVSATDLHPKSLDRQLKKIVQSDIPLTLTSTEEPLPPLIIDREMVKRRSELLVSLKTG
jgi:hypothetical protein